MMKQRTIFIHGCCSDGVFFLQQYINGKNNLGIIVGNHSMTSLHARDNGTLLKYNIDISSLKSKAYIVELYDDGTYNKIVGSR